MKGISESSKKISDIISVIDSIAFRPTSGLERSGGSRPCG